MENTLYDVMVYPYHFSSKREAQQKTGIVKNNILKYPQQLTVEEIAKTCVSGQPIAFCHAEGQSKHPTCKKSFTVDTWKYQQIYALDFDNADRGRNKFESPYYMEISEAVKHAKRRGFSPAFAYTTGSHKEDHHKFRLVFVLDRRIESVLEHQKVQKAFLAMFSIDGTTVLDSSCTDPARLFYSGKDLVYTDYTACILVDELLEKYPFSKYKYLKRLDAATDKADTNAYVYNDEVQEIIKEIQAIEKSRKIAAKSLQSRVSTRLKDYRGGKRSKHNYNMFTSPDKQNPAKPYVARSCEDFDDYCYKIPIEDVFGLEYGKPFNCLLPEHEDGNASASIVWNKDRHKYRCFGCGTTYDIFGLLKALSGCNRHAVSDWLCKRFNIVYETEWQKFQKEEILIYHDYMVKYSSEEYPDLYKAIAKGSVSGTLNMVLDIARMYILDRDFAQAGMPTFVYPLSKFSKDAEYYGITQSVAQLNKNLTYLSHLGLIKVLNDEELSPTLRRYLKKYQCEHDQRMRTSCYAIPPLSPELLEQAQQIVLNDKSNSVRKSYLCREQIIRANGQEHADTVYVQSKNVERNPEAEKFYKRYKAATEKLLEKKGWTVEEEILNRLKGFTKQEKKKWSGVCLPQLLTEMNLQRVSFTKAIEEDYHVVQTRSVKLTYGSSPIIVPV